MVKKTESPIKKLSEVAEVRFLSTGVDELDAICSFPIGLITTIYGNSSVGKTDLALRAAVSASKASKRVLFCDVEQRLNPKRIDALGGSRELIDYSSEYVQEDVAEMIIGAIDHYDLIIVDSVAQLMPRAERDGEMGDANIGLRAKLNWKWIRIAQGKLARSNCALVLISQLRQSPNMFKPTYVAGGDNLIFNSSLMLQLSSNGSTDKIIKDKELVGRKVTAKITKSNLGQLKDKQKYLYLNQEAVFKLLF